ncbi:MAG: hypothetical protein HYW91_03300 [Candidatus Sungbacteria bacterium]|nr:hypothetical protein [Candidatus Sungbacteria bacterium]
MVEREFIEDLQLLLQEGKITDIQRNKALDSRGVDALIVRRDGRSIKINVMVDSIRSMRWHQKVNRRLARKDAMRIGILLWRHNSNINPQIRRQALLRAIEEHDSYA